MTADKEEELVDLSSLQGLSLEPDWAKKSKTANPGPNFGEQGKGKQEGKRSGRKGRSNRRPPSQKRFFNENPTFDFAIHPNLEVMQKIKSEMRKTGISYGLAEICDTISSDPGRYNLVVNHKDKDKPPFVATKFDKRVFETKERAVEHLFAYYSEERFTSKIEREEKPGKNFPYVFECPLTKSLLPPNNYHDFDEIIIQHIFLNSISKPYDAYVASLARVDEAERIQEWNDKPIVLYKFGLHGQEAGEMMSLAQLRKKCLDELPVNLFSTSTSIKVSGSDLALLDENIGSQFNAFFKSKGNWIKGLFASCLVNLKKSNFTVFRYSEKKFTFASAYQRKELKDATLNETSEKITSAMGKGQEVNKATLLNDEALGEIDRKSILIELKWLVKEGYVTEFGNGILVLN